MEIDVMATRRSQVGGLQMSEGDREVALVSNG